MTTAINRSLAHGLETLLLFDASRPLLSVADISKRLRYSQSKTYRLVRTLIKYGLLQENGRTARYCLGLNALRMGLLARQNINLSAIARPFMEELSHLTKETVFLTAVNGTKAICLERVESAEPIRFSFFQPGADLPLHCRAMCKVLMAFLPEEDWEKIIAKEGLKRYTPNTITRVAELKAHLREIRKKGYAFSDQEVDRDVRAVAAPILNRWGELVAGLSIAGPSYRIKKKTVGRFAKLVVDCAKRISSNLG